MIRTLVVLTGVACVGLAGCAGSQESAGGGSSGGKSRTPSGAYEKASPFETGKDPFTAQMSVPVEGRKSK